MLKPLLLTGYANMKTLYSRHSRSGFTLIELMIAMTIFAIMGTMTILIYFHVSETSRRMQISRELSETARQITERMASDVSGKGIGTGTLDVSGANNWADEYEENYKNQGSEVLPIDGEKSMFYVYGKKTENGIIPCGDADKDDIQTLCALYLGENGEFYNLVDSFRADESAKRVKVTDAKFFISGDERTAQKVTLKMTLELMPRAGVPPSLVRATKLEIQSTFSERNYTH